MSIDLYDPEKRVQPPEELLSPSGKYRLVLEYFGTGRRTWNVLQGTLYLVGVEEPLAVIKRNYSVFPYSWVEGHPNGHDYIVAGENYQGQTVVELDTGSRRDHLPAEASQGRGFCWASYHYDRRHNVLVVDGCYWACPYEIRLYDFSDPLNGWPHLKLLDAAGKESYIPSEGEKSPVISDDGLVTVYQTKDIYDYPADYGVEALKDVVEWEGPPPEDPDNDERFTVVATKTYRLKDRKLIFESEWVSDHEQAYRERRLRDHEKAKAERDYFRRTDPLYQAYLKEVKNSAPLSPVAHETCGFTYEGWCPGLTLNERRWCRRITQTLDDNKRPKGYTIDFEWAEKTGPIKLTIFKNGEKVEDKFWMEHSVESIQAAFSYAKELVS